MNVIVIDSEAFEALKREMKKSVKEAVENLLTSKNMQDSNDWITFQKAKEILPFTSKTTWQELRDKGVCRQDKLD